MIEEMFLWSAICSAKTTNATGAYATAIVPIYAPLSSPKAPNAVRNVKSGNAKNVPKVTPFSTSAEK